MSNSRELAHEWATGVLYPFMNSESSDYAFIIRKRINAFLIYELGTDLKDPYISFQPRFALQAHSPDMPSMNIKMPLRGNQNVVPISREMQHQILEICKYPVETFPGIIAPIEMLENVIMDKSTGMPVLVQATLRVLTDAFE